MLNISTILYLKITFILRYTNWERLNLTLTLTRSKEWYMYPAIQILGVTEGFSSNDGTMQFSNAQKVFHLMAPRNSWKTNKCKSFKFFAFTKHVDCFKCYCMNGEENNTGPSRSFIELACVPLDAVIFE